MLNPTKSIEYIGYSMLVRRVVILTVFFLSLTAMAGAETRLFLLRGNSLHVLSGTDGSALEERILETDGSGSHDMIFGTPGGKYVFVVDSETGRGTAVDFSNPESGKSIDLSSAAPLSAAVFSPMGDVLYLTSNGRGGVISYRHKAGELGIGEHRVLSGDSSGISSGKRFALNSRGTRLYMSGPEGLAYHLISDGSLLKRVSDISENMDWTMAPGGRYLWGSGDSGWTVVDEQRGRVAARIQAETAGRPEFESTGRTGWALADSGRLLMELDTRRHKVIRQETLHEPLSGPVPGDDGKIWLAGNDSLYLAHSGIAIQSAGELPGSGDVKALISVTLRPGQGFACF